MMPEHDCDRVVIFDRDGTMVIDRAYLEDPAGLEFAPGAARAVRWLYDRQYRLVVITNQSGVGRGFFPLASVIAMNARLQAMVEGVGARLEGIYFCPHAPEAGCMCRKPALGLLHQAARDLGFDPACAIVVGDKASDVAFGRRAGAKTVLIAPTVLPAAGSGAVPDVVAANILEAAYAIPTLTEARQS